ncbi:endonuclease/exonuclease/phosphatase family protein, partial [Sulfitobacter sp. HI0023]|uniref:endonuclease/exonuclease/phosphatase family protein n=2 Tax=Sulfitobacter TaxID=60136 RepID=UPI000ABC08C7
RFILLGDANLDPHRGAGRRAAIAALLAHPAMQDPMSDIPTVTWDQTGPMRVDYLLPSKALTVLRTGQKSNTAASRHALIWADLTR